MNELIFESESFPGTKIAFVTMEKGERHVVGDPENPMFVSRDLGCLTLYYCSQAGTIDWREYPANHPTWVEGLKSTMTRNGWKYVDNHGILISQDRDFISSKTASDMIVEKGNW